MNPQEKRAYWESHLAAQRKSRLNQKEYCSQNGLKKATFGYWKKRLAATENKKCQRLIPVKVEPNGIIAITIQGNVRLEVPECALANVLPDILKAANGEILG